MNSKKLISRALAATNAQHDNDLKARQRAHDLLVEALEPIVEELGCVPAGLEFQITSREVVIKNANGHNFALSMSIEPLNSLQGILRKMTFVENEASAEGASRKQVIFLEKLISSDLRFEIKIVHQRGEDCLAYITFRPI